MSDLPHLRLEGTESPESYTYAGPTPVGVTFDRPARNPPVHARTIRQAIRGVGAEVQRRRATDAESYPDLVEWQLEGVVLTFSSDPGHELNLDRLERDGATIHLLGVKVVDGVQIARVFVPEGRITAFLKLVEGYASSIVLTYIATPEDEALVIGLAEPDNGIRFRGPVRHTRGTGAPRIKVQFVVAEAQVDRFKEKVGTQATLVSEGRRHQELIDSIASVRLAIVSDFWQDRLPFPGPDEEIWWEFWLRGTRATAAETHRRFTQLAEITGIRPVSPRYVAFPERVVVHARATAQQISASIDLMATIGELRKAKELASHYLDLSAEEQADFVHEVVRNLIPPSMGAPCVSVLDAGVNRPHPLLAPVLAADDQHAAQSEWGVGDHDEEQHGTGMAGIALYGCLTGVLRHSGPVRLRHRLESIKILPPPPGTNEPPDYGRRMQDGVSLAHIGAPTRNRALCMAVTASDHRDGGVPSLWSGAVDDLCAGVVDGAPKLMFISAGNLRYEIARPDYVYHVWNTTRGGIEDPGQAWNALTIGAYTELAAPDAPGLVRYSRVAEPGDLCPTSRTSLAWPLETRDGWPIKPDLVLEGGNYVRQDGPPLTCAELSLLTTCMRPGRLLTITHDTSPATALAARMAAIVWSYHPNLRPETVRALLVHSANWTPAMESRFPGNSRTAVLRRLRCYGYGVPDLQRALHSANHAVTMIYEGQLQPFHLDGGEVRTHHMNIHELPWPVEVLEDLGDEQVTMRVTLSYFVEPSPNNVGWGVNHRYASHGLRFDVIRPTENLARFKRRISRDFWDAPNTRPRDNAKEERNWTVGEDARSLGSIHSDWWTGSAVTLARSGKIVVYPVTGWWKERKHLGRYSQPARYSLVVSIRSRRTTTDLYTAITTVGAVQTEVIT